METEREINLGIKGKKRTDSSATLNISDRKNSSKKIDSSNNTVKKPASSKISEKALNFFINALTLNDITDAKLKKDKTFHKIVTGLLETSKATKSSSLDLLAQVLTNEIKSTNDASKPIIKELKANADEQLIFNLRATLQSIIINEKNERIKANKSKKENDKVNNSQNPQAEKKDNNNEEIKIPKNEGKEEEESEIYDSQNFQVENTDYDNSDIKTEPSNENEEEKSEINEPQNTATVSKDIDNGKSSLQQGAEQSIEILHKILWELDPLGRQLVLKHIKEPLRIILDIVVQFYLITKYIKPLTKEDKLEQTDETKNIVDSYIQALVAIAEKYIKGAAEESHPANMKSIPEGVTATIIAIAMGAILEYYSQPHEKGRVLPHKLISEEGVEFELEIPIELIIKIFKSITSLQLDHGITEDAENLGKEAKSFFNGKKITDHLFSNDQLIQDLSNLVYSIKFLLHFESSLDGKDKGFIKTHLPEIVAELINQTNANFAQILQNTKKRQQDFSKQFATIENFLKKIKNGSGITDDDFKNLQDAVQALPRDDSNKKELTLRNELVKIKNAKAFLDEQKNLRPKLENILAAKKLSENELELFAKIENFLKSTETLEFKSELNSQPEQALEAFIKTFFTLISEYKIKKLAPKYKEQLGNPAFKELIYAITEISLKKDLSQADIDVIIKTLAIKLENMKKFSNPALGKALYHAFVESIPITDDEIDIIESSLTNNNLHPIPQKLFDKKLANKLCEIFMETLPTDSDIKKIVKCLRKDKQKQTKILTQLTKLKNKKLGKQLYEKFLKGILEADNKSIKESDVNIILESLEPKNYEPLLQLSSKTVGNAFYTLFNKTPPSEKDATTIVKCLQTEDITELSKLEDKKLIKTLSAFLDILFKKKATLLLEKDINIIADGLQPQNYDFLLALSNKERGAKLHRIISKYRPDTKDAETIVKALQNNKLSEFSKLTNKNLSDKLFKLCKTKINLTEQDNKLIAKISEPRNYDSLKELTNKKIGKQFHDIISKAQPSERDASKIIKSLQNNTLSELAELENESLSEKLQTLFFNLSKKDVNQIIANLKTGNYNALQNISNKEIGIALHTILNATPLSKSDAKSIANCLEKNELNKLLKLKNNTLATTLHALFTLLTSKEHISLTTEDITTITESLEPKNYTLFRNLSNEKLGQELHTLFSETPPDEEDTKKIVNCLREDELWQKKDLSELLKLKDKRLGAKLYHALVSAIPFTKDDATKFSECLQDNQIENLSQISNPELGNSLRQAFINNFLPPEKIVLAICDSLKNRTLENLKICGYPELGERLYYMLLQTIAPKAEDKAILTGIIGDLSIASHETVNTDDKRRIFEKLKKYTNQKFVKELKKSLDNLQFSRASFREALASLLSYNKLEDLTGKGSPGNEIYNALTQSIPLSPEDIKTINRSLKTKNLEEIRKIDNTDLGPKLFDVFKNSTSYSLQDIELSTQVFLDPFQKLNTLSFAELGKVLYSCFSKAASSEKPPIITDSDIKIIIEGLINKPETIKKISDPIGEVLCEAIKENILTNEDKYNLLKAFLDSKPEELKNISNTKLADPLYKAFSNLRLKNSFEFTPLQKFLITAIVATPNSLIGFLEQRLNKKKKEEKSLLPVEQLPDMLFNGIKNQPDKNFLDTLGQLPELPVPDFLKNILNQLKYYFTDTDNEFCHELEKLLYSASFLPASFEITQKLFDNAEFKKRIGDIKQKILEYNNALQKPSKKLDSLVQSQNFFADFDKLPSKRKKDLLEKIPNLNTLLKNPGIEFREKLIAHTKEIKNLSKELETLFSGNDFLQDYAKLSDNTKKELQKHLETSLFYNIYSSFILLVLFTSHPLGSKDFENIKLLYDKTAKMGLESFTWKALSELGMDEDEWPALMKKDNDPINQQVLENLTKLGLSPVIGYKDNEECTEEEQIYPEVLIKIGMRMTGLFGDTTKFSPENSFHKLLIKHCCVRSTIPAQEKSGSQESFEQFQFKSPIPMTSNGNALAARIKNIAIASIPSLVQNDEKLLTDIFNFAITVAYQLNTDASDLFLYCIGNQLTGAIEAAFRAEKETIDIVALKHAILTSNIEAVKAMLNKASKFDLTIYTCKNEKDNILLLAYEADKNLGKENIENCQILKAITEHLIKTQQPYPLIVLNSPNEDLRRYLEKAVERIGLDSRHYIRKKLFSSPKTTTSSHSGDSSSEDPESQSHSSTERSTEKTENTTDLPEVTTENAFTKIFKSYLDQDEANRKNLAILLKDDPNATFLTDSFKPPVVQELEKIIDKFINAAYITFELVNPEVGELEVRKLSEVGKLISTKLMPFLIAKDKISKKNIEAFLEKDPQATFLTDYLNELIKSHKTEKSQVPEEILDKFIVAAKTTLELINPEFKKSVLKTLVSFFTEKENLFKLNETMTEFSSWLRLELNYENFSTHISNDTSSDENLEKIFKEDPAVTYLVRYITELTETYNRKKPENAARIAKKFAEATKATIKLIPSAHLNSIIEVLLLALAKAQPVFYDTAVESLIQSLKKTAVTILKLMLSKQIEVSAKNLKQLFEINCDGATESLISNLRELNKEDALLINILEIILQEDFFYFDIDPNKADFVSNKLLPILKENKALSKKKNIAQLLKNYDKKLLTVFTPENLAIKYAEKIMQLLKTNCPNTTNLLISYIQKLPKDDIKLTNVVKMLIEDEIIYFDKNPDKTDFVINKLLPALKANKALANEKSSIAQLLKMHEDKLNTTLAPQTFAFTFAVKESCELTDPNSKSIEKENLPESFSNSKSFTFSAKYSPSYSRRPSEIDVENEIKRMVETGDLEIKHAIVLGLFMKDSKKTVAIIQKYTQHFFDETYKHNFGYLVDLLEVIYKNKISANGVLAIEYFIADIKNICKQTHAPGSGKRELCNSLRLNIVAPYDKLKEEENKEGTKIEIKARTKTLN